MVRAGFVGTAREAEGQELPFGAPEHQKGLRRAEVAAGVREVIHTSEHGSEGEHLVYTVKLAGGQQGFGQLRGQREL